MTPVLLPSTADRSLVTTKVFSLEDQKEYVVPLAGGAAGDGVNGVRIGEATLVGGTIAVANPAVTATSVILLTRRTLGGTVGNLSFTRSAGVGFTINSSNVLETSAVNWAIMGTP